LKKRWIRLFTLSAFVLSLMSLLRGMPHGNVSAESLTPQAYLPLIYRPEPVRFDDFEDGDPEWIVTNRARQPEDKDGTFRHTLIEEPWYGVLRGEVRDNAVRLVATPGWRPLGDFRLDVDARFRNKKHKSLDGLGLVFGGNDDFSEYYVFMLANGAAQHFWGIFRFEGYDSHSIDRDAYIGAPGFVHDWDGWNRLTVVRVQDQILLYCNGRKMLDQPYDYTDAHYGTNRLVGLTITSYELNWQDVDFENFRLTPLSMPY